MENIHDTILELKDLVKENSGDNSLLNEKVVNVIEALVNKVEELQVNIETLDENVSLINDDLSGVQGELFEELTLEELDEYDDEYCEVVCEHCNKPLYVEKSVVDSTESIPCPYCKESFKV